MAKSNRNRVIEIDKPNPKLNRFEGSLHRLFGLFDSLLRLKIKGKLGIAFVGFSAMPILVLGMLAWHMNSKTIKDSSVRELSHLAEVINIRLKDFTEVVQMDLRFIIEGFKSSRTDKKVKATVSDYPDQTISVRQALNLMNIRPRYSGITFLVDSLKADWFSLLRSPFEQGRIIPRQSKYSWNYYQILVQDLPSEQMRLTPVELIDAITGNTFAAFSYAMPYRNERGDLEGILIADIFADQIFSIIETTLDKTSHYTAGIVDRDGHYLYHSVKKQYWNQLIAESSFNNLQNDFTKEFVNEIFLDTPGVFVTEQSDVVYHIPLEMGAFGLNQKYFFYLTQPGSIIFSPLHKFGLISLVIAIVFVAVALVLSRVATRRFVNPIQKLQEGSDIIAKGNFSHKINISTGDEIEHLANKFNYMARSIQERDRKLKEYGIHLEEQIAERTQELQDEKDKLRIILDNVPSAFILLDSNQKVLTASSALKQLTNYPPQKAVGQKCYEVLNHPPMCEHCIMWRSQETGMLVREEYRVDDGEGGYRMLELMSIPVKLTSGERACLEVLSDITRRVRLQNQLLQSEKLASLGEMAAVIAHEIRNSLTSTNMLLQLIHETNTLEPAEKESLEVVLSSTSRINKITNDLLSFARPAPLHKQSVDPIDLIQEGINLYRRHFESRNIHTELQLPTNLPRVQVDPNLMREVLANILLNAYQAVERDGKVLMTADVVTMQDEVTKLLEFDFSRNGKSFVGTDNELLTGKALRIMFQDDGPGIPQNSLQKIFDPFYTTKVNGTGLGLSMARRVVEAHNGGIYATSENGRGATITIIIPLESNT